MNEEEHREYTAMIQLDETVSALRECGWTREQLIDRVETLVDDLEADE